MSSPHQRHNMHNTRICSQQEKHHIKEKAEILLVSDVGCGLISALSVVLK